MKQYKGHQGETDYLLTIFDDGTTEFCTRKQGSGWAWMPPVPMEQLEDGAA